MHFLHGGNTEPSIVQSRHRGHLNLNATNEHDAKRDNTAVTRQGKPSSRIRRH